MNASAFRLALSTEDGVPVETRELGAGQIVIGRGEDADWRLDDPDRLLSRRHCEVRVEGGRAMLVDLSTNGVFLGDRGVRCTPNRPVPLEAGQTIVLGGYRIVVEPVEEAPPTRIAALAEPAAAPAKLPPPDGEAAGLLEAFCAGAGLQVSAFANEDPAALIRTLGGVYREMVAGLAALMAERTAAKGDHALEHTTVGPVDNNPFRWAKPERLMSDVLRTRQDGFLSGPTAVRASVEDLAAHLAASDAGFSAMVAAVMARLDPEVLANAVSNPRNLLVGRKAAAWDAYAAAHAALAEELALPESEVGDAFRRAYASELRQRAHKAQVAGGPVRRAATP